MAYATLADVRAYLKHEVAETDDDDLLTDMLARAQSIIDTYTQRTFEGSAENRTFDAAQDVEGGVLWVYGAGDLASISTVTNGDGSTVLSTAYVTEPRNAVARGVPIRGIRLKLNSSVYWRSADGVPEDAITVNGVWAYSATPPADITHWCVRLTAWLYRQKDNNADVEQPLASSGVLIVPSAIPKDIRVGLDAYRRLF